MIKYTLFEGQGRMHEMEAWLVDNDALVDKWFNKIVHNKALKEMIGDNLKAKRDIVLSEMLGEEVTGRIANITIGSEEMIEYFERDFEEVRLQTHFYTNVKRALNRAGLMEELERDSGEPFDIERLDYLGGNSYLYMGLWLIDFHNSPFEVIVQKVR